MEEMNLNEEVVVEVEETNATDIATYEVPEEPESDGQLNVGAIVLGSALFVSGCLLAKEGIKAGVRWLKKLKAKKHQTTGDEEEPENEDDVVDVELDEDSEEEISEKVSEKETR